MQETRIDTPYLTYKESADYCRVDRSTIYRAVKSGQLRQCGPGSVVRFHRDELDRWMNSGNEQK